MKNYEKDLKNKIINPVASRFPYSFYKSRFIFPDEIVYSTGSTIGVVFKYTKYSFLMDFSVFYETRFIINASDLFFTNTALNEVIDHFQFN